LRLWWCEFQEDVKIKVNKTRLLNARYERSRG
jgi:hypothetical protein